MAMFPANSRFICVFPRCLAKGLRVVGHAYTFCHRATFVDVVSIFQATLCSDLGNSRLRTICHSSVSLILAVPQSCCLLGANQLNIISACRCFDVRVSIHASR